MFLATKGLTMSAERISRSYYLDKDLIQELEFRSQERATSPDDLLSECIRYYLEHALRESRVHLVSPSKEAITGPHNSIQGLSQELYVHYNDTSDLIHKERFTIGREEGCDLVINHNGISRKHCEVLYEGGEYMIVDTNSFNGVEFAQTKQKISRRHILEGDSFYLCDLEISFSYQG